MKLARSLVVPTLVYALVAVVVLWPGVFSGWEMVPGGMRTDLWNGLWSLDFGRSALLAGEAPWAVDVLAFPTGGNLPPIDPLALLFLLPVGLLGSAVAYQLLIVARLAMGGVIAHRFAEEFCHAHGVQKAQAKTAAWVAGVTVASAPVLIAGVHNGTSEAANGCGLLFSVWMSWRFGREPNRGNAKGMVFGLVWAALTSWYVAVLAFAHAGFVALFHARSQTFLRRCLPVVVGFLCVLPWVFAVVVLLQVGEANLTAHGFEVGAGNAGLPPDNFGAADWAAWFGASGSRDIAILAPFEAGQGFFHNTHIPWVVVILAVIGIRRVWRKESALVALALLSFVFSFGLQASFAGLDVPMPYGYLATLPGFSQLSLPFRFGIGVVPVAVVFAALGAQGQSRKRMGLLCAAVLLQLRFLSPVSGGVPATDLSAIHDSEALNELALSPDGGVVHFPIWSQHPTLYAQRVHGKPITVSLNRASSETDLSFWKAARMRLQLGQKDAFIDHVREIGIRYLVADGGDPRRRGDPHFSFYKMIRENFQRLGTEGENGGIEVYALW
jgi:hypothetical protein